MMNAPSGQEHAVALHNVEQHVVWVARQLAAPLVDGAFDSGELGRPMTVQRVTGPVQQRKVPQSFNPVQRVRALSVELLHQGREFGELAKVSSGWKSIPSEKNECQLDSTRSAPEQLLQPPDCLILFALM